MKSLNRDRHFLMLAKNALTFLLQARRRRPTNDTRFCQKRVITYKIFPIKKKLLYVFSSCSRHRLGCCTIDRSCGGGDTFHSFWACFKGFFFVTLNCFSGTHNLCNVIQSNWAFLNFVQCTWHVPWRKQNVPFIQVGWLGNSAVWLGNSKTGLSICRAPSFFFVVAMKNDKL